MLRTVSICWDARFAAIDRFRFWRVRFSELAMPTARPVMTRPKMKMAIIISTIVKPASSPERREAERSCWSTRVIWARLSLSVT